MKDRFALSAAAGFLVVMLAFSCSRPMEPRTEASYEATGPAMMSAPAPSGAAGPGGRVSIKADVPGTPQPEGDGRPADAAAGRKLVFQASMDIEAPDLPATETFIDEAVRAAGGYVARRNADGNSVFMQLRVPVPALEGLMEAFAGQGRTLGRSLVAEDVTDSYFDLEGRLRNKRLLEARYRDYLGEAATMDEILQVERSLSEVTNDIEWLEGTFRELGKRIELATLSVSVRPVYSSDPSRPTLGQSLQRLFGGFGDALRIFVVILAGLVLYGIPAVLVLAGLWWLSFGRLGLVRHLFTFAGKGRKKPGSGS